MPSPSTHPAKSPPLLPSALPKDSSTSSDQTIIHSARNLYTNTSRSSEPNDPISHPPQPQNQDNTHSASTSLPPPRPPFSPLFTLIESTPSQTHHHPQIHYLFSDDDSDALTDAALRIEEQRAQWAAYQTQLTAFNQAQARARERRRDPSKDRRPHRSSSNATATAAPPDTRSRSSTLRQSDRDSSSTRPPHGQSHDSRPRQRATSRASLSPHPHGQASSREHSLDRRRRSPSPSISSSPPQPPPLSDRERVILVSLDESGREVASAHSLSADWAVLSARITPAASLEGEGKGGMMLRIEGMEAARGGGEEDRGREIEEVVERFRGRVEGLGRVVRRVDGEGALVVGGRGGEKGRGPGED